MLHDFFQKKLYQPYAWKCTALFIIIIIIIILFIYFGVGSLTRGSSHF